MYMNSVPIPPLCMVDDIATINKCNTINGIDMNVKSDVFVKGKKLEFQVKGGKCQYVHIGNKTCTSKYYANGKQLGLVISLPTSRISTRKERKRLLVMLCHV